MYLIVPERDGNWVYDPGTCMALQVYAKDYLQLDDDVLLPYMMDPAIQIGKFQNAYEEVNTAYIEANDIKVIRRDTGGGAIYIDDKNMNFVFLLDGNTDIFGNYDKLYEPIIRALKKLGVKHVEQSGRNDLTIDGKKISGAAMTLENGRIYCGYSLLLDPDCETMVAALNPKQKKIQSHGIKSVRSRVTGIRSFLDERYQTMDVWEFTNFIICELLEITTMSDAKRYSLTEEDWKKIDQIAIEKYNNWDWTYGQFREFDMKISERISIGTIDVDLTIKRGIIKDIQITGDFFGRKNISDIENALIGIQYKHDKITTVLKDFSLLAYFGHISAEALAELLMNNK